MNMQVAELCDVPENVKRTAFLPTLGISTTDFDITRDQKCDLMNAAYESTAAYLSAPDHDESCPQHVMELVRKLRQ